MVELIYVSGFFSENVEKLQGLQQVAEFGAFFGSTPQQQHQPRRGGWRGIRLFDMLGLCGSRGKWLFGKKWAIGKMFLRVDI